MKLGPKFAKAILHGARPALTDEPDLEQGELIQLKRFFVWIRPLKQDKDGIWTYAVRDDRPPPFRMKATGPLPRDELATIIHGQSVRREPEPEITDAAEVQRDRLKREVDVRNAYRQEQHRQREEKTRLEFGLARARQKGRKGSVIAMEERLKRVSGRVDEAA